MSHTSTAATIKTNGLLGTIVHAALKLIRSAFIASRLIACLMVTIPTASSAHNKVVVIPLSETSPVSSCTATDLFGSWEFMLLANNVSSYLLVILENNRSGRLVVPVSGNDPQGGQIFNISWHIQNGIFTLISPQQTALSAQLSANCTSMENGQLVGLAGELAEFTGVKN